MEIIASITGYFQDPVQNLAVDVEVGGYCFCIYPVPEEFLETIEESTTLPLTLKPSTLELLSPSEYTQVM